MCVCVCVCVFYTFDKTVPREKKKLDVHINVYFIGGGGAVSIYLTSIS